VLGLGVEEGVEGWSGVVSVCWRRKMSVRRRFGVRLKNIERHDLGPVHSNGLKEFEREVSSTKWSRIFVLRHSCTGTRYHCLN
jgi:hypothetical protein